MGGLGTFKEGVDLNVGLGGRGQGALGPLAGRAEAAEGTLVGGDVLAVLLLELAHAVLDL